MQVSNPLSPPSDPVQRRLQSPSAKSNFLAVKDYKFTGSFPTKIEKSGDHGSARRLDYVFASPTLAKRVTRAEVIANDITWKLSDHLPVVVDLD